MSTNTAATKSKVMPTSPIAKPPTAINNSSRIGDIEDDVESFKPKEKQTVNNPQTGSTGSSTNERGQQQSPQRSPQRQEHPGSPKKSEGQKPTQSGQQGNFSKSAMDIHVEGSGNLYNPYEDLKHGASEEEVLAKVKQENAKLRKELKTISDDLTLLVEKKKMEKKEKDAPRVTDILAGATSTEQGLLKELELAKKKLEQYEKEVEVAKEKAHVQSYEKYQKMNDDAYEKDHQLQELVAEKRELEKQLREKEKFLDSLLQKTETKTDVLALDEKVRYLREKARESDRKKEQFEKQTQKRKEYSAKLVEEINAMKAEYKKIQTKTGYEHKEVPKSEPVTKRPTAPEEIKKKNPISKHIEEEIACTIDNFEKLKKEIKIIERAEGLRGKKNDRRFDDISDQIDAVERHKDEVLVKMAERKKEIDLLQTKLKDLSRIVRHHALAPLQEELAQKEKETSQSLVKPEKKLHRRNVKAPKTKKEDASPKKPKPQPYHLLVEYAKHNFQSKGFRKDERGKVLREDEGINFNDKDVVGKQKVKIIAMDIWHDDNCINGLQGVYENEAGEIIEGGAQVKNADKSKMVTFETLEEDFVKEITGFINKSETVIESLILRTFRGETMRVGTASKDAKLFKFDINELEYPAIFFGSIREDKNGGASKLARLGVLIATQSVEEQIAATKERPGAEEKKEDGEEEDKEKEEHEEKEEKEEGEEQGDEHGEGEQQIEENIPMQRDEPSHRVQHQNVEKK